MRSVITPRRSWLQEQGRKGVRQECRTHRLSWRSDAPAARRDPARVSSNLKEFLLSIVSPELRCYGLKTADRCGRLALLQAVIFFFVGAVAFRLFSVQAAEHEKWLALAAKQHDTSIEIQGVRGTLRDRDGRVLVTSKQVASVAAHPRTISSPHEASIQLAALVDLPAPAIEERLRAEKDKPFIWLTKGLSREKGEVISDAGIKGIEVFPEYERLHPNGNLASVVLGRVSSGGAGQSGIELGFNDILSAVNGRLELQRDARGGLFSSSASEIEGNVVGDISSRFQEIRRAVEEFPFVRVAVADQELALAKESSVDSAPIRQQGGEIVLTLDVFLQKILEEELEKGIVDARARRTFGVLLDADNGEVLAMGQMPRAAVASNVKVELDDLRNVVIQDSFEPGSTFKPLIAALALENKRVNMSELIDCENGSYRAGSHTIRDVHPVGTVTASEVLVRSSNIGMMKMGQRLGREALVNGLKEFGLGAVTGIELPGEGKGILKAESQWRDIDVVTASFGQGLSLTPLQLVRAYATLANGGKLVTPTIIRRSGSDWSEKAVQVFSADTAAQISRALVGVTVDEHGTGKQAALAGVPVSGKTGTAEKPRTNGRGYDPDRVFSSFVGYIDGSPVGVSRRLVLYIGVDEPGVKPRWGGVVAAPVFRRAMERALSHLMAERGEGMRTAAISRPRVG